VHLVGGVAEISRSPRAPGWRRCWTARNSPCCGSSRRSGPPTGRPCCCLRSITHRASSASPCNGSAGIAPTSRAGAHQGRGMAGVIPAMRSKADRGEANCDTRKEQRRDRR
jgi:hypothetical protein